MITIILIFIGCGLGGVMRYWVSSATHLLLSNNFPFGTLVVNVSGSFLMGLLFILILERYSGMTSQLRAFLLIGFLGGYTTFSSFSIETLNLIEKGSIISAISNIFFSNVLCFIAVWIGAILGRNL